jgi:CYTH domain-containing protein
MASERVGKYACAEFERRFLVRTLPDQVVAGKYEWRILDRYIPGTRLRLRRMESPKGDRIQRKLTQKFSESSKPTTRTTITNIYLDEGEYRVLEALGGNEILKDRHIEHFQGHRFGIDVFRGRHQGLILAEVEAESPEALGRVPIPEFCTCEVTNDVFFTGGVLSVTNAQELISRIVAMLGTSRSDYSSSSP